MHRNFEYLNSLLNISEESFRALQKISTKRTFKANEVIAKAGESATKLYQLNSGIIRAYVYTESGRELNKNLFSPTSFVGPLTSIITTQPSAFTYQALTDCMVYELDFHQFNNLCKTNIEISNLYNKILERVFLKYEQRQLELISLDATERYLKLKKDIPNIENLIP